MSTNSQIEPAVKAANASSTTARKTVEQSREHGRCPYIECLWIVAVVAALCRVISFLAHAKTIAGSRPLAWLSHTDIVETVDPFDGWKFWPFFAENDCAPCEPDLVVRLDRGGEKPPVVVLIEAKFHSGKSSVADAQTPHPTDQLAKEWDNLLQVADEGAELYVVYLTDGIGVPADDINDSIQEWRDMRPGAEDPKILALSWRDLGVVCRDVLNDNLQATPHVLRAWLDDAGGARLIASTLPIDPQAKTTCLIFVDLYRMLCRLQLTYFYGVHVPRVSVFSIWQFNTFPTRWTRIETVPTIQWSFSNG
ncbi:MAG: hypothetical protein R3C10_09715 [Pirellulales bacterium]